MFHNSQRDQEFSLSPTEDPFRILAIYDGAKGSAEAARASALVIRELGEDVPIDRCSWSVEALESFETRGFAAGEATRADLIVLALSAEKPSESLKDWVRQWEKNRKLSSGLLALIPFGKKREVQELEDYLNETAITANMDFLCRKDLRSLLRPGKRVDEKPNLDRRHSAHRETRVVSAVLHVGRRERN